ncbi:MAG TPA: PIN domain-containing protein [Rhizomicrobium sp.]|jgi:predicted nucleic acid-binding protein|nr:PIN domain-containing protein [Rhizomicrobium sp.]
MRQTGEAEHGHEAATDIIRAARRVDTGLTEQAIVEFVNVAIRKAKLPLDETLPFVQEFLASFRLLLPTDTIVDDVLDLLSRYNLSAWDARLLAVCNAHDCEYLLSEDIQDGARYGKVTVINPFDPANADVLNRLLAS